jgi:hypothetical protein
MIEELEKSPSNRAKCVKCQKTIILGELRGVENISIGIRNGFKYYCSKCSLSELKNNIEKFNIMIEKLKCQNIQYQN